MNQVRFPLSDFAGVDLNNIRAVRFRFTRTLAGMINVSDLAFAGAA
jgi:hypothetical protein